MPIEYVIKYKKNLVEEQKRENHENSSSIMDWHWYRQALPYNLHSTSNGCNTE